MTEVDNFDHKTPAGLGARAQWLWDQVTDGRYQLRADDLLILEQACRQVDLVDRIEARLRLGTLTVRGPFGGSVIHPLIPEVRQHRAVVARLLAQLKLPDETGRPIESTSEKARRAANARWGNNGPK